MKRTMEVKEEIINFRNSRTRDRVTLSPTPGSVSKPAGLVIHAGGRPAAEGKLSRHCQREAEMAHCSLAIRNPVM